MQGNSNLSVEAGGKLIIQGTEQAPVLFTSSTASPGSWQGITVNGERSDGGDIQISYATIEYANYGVYFSQGAKADITHSVIRNNNVGLYYYGARTGGTVHSSQLYNNQSGVYIYGGYNYLADHPKPVITGNSIYDNSAYNYRVVFYRDTNKTVLDATGNWWGTTDLAVITGKIYDMVDDANSPLVDYRQMLQSENGDIVPGVQILGDIASETRWQADDVLVLAATKVLSGAHLIIESGTRVKFAKGAQLVVDKNARLSIVGEEGNPVVLTSDQQTPTAGDWKGILVNAENGAVTISNATIEYADKGVYLVGKKAKATITNSKIENNNYGVFVDGGNAAYDDHPVPVVTNDVIAGNNKYNYYTQSFSGGSSRTFNAKGNYWGTSDSAAIATSIYDNSDSSSLPIVDSGHARSSEKTDVVADAGPDKVGFGTVETLLPGSGSSNAAITGYDWQQYLGEPLTLVNSDTAQASFTTADVQNEKLYSFIFTVTDENGISASDKMNVVVKPFSEYNTAPVVAESKGVLVSANDAVSATLPASDADNDPLTYSWQQTGGEPVSLGSTDTDTLTFTAPEKTEDSVYRFTLTVSDGHYTVKRDLVVAVKARLSAAGTYYYHNDHLGTPQVMTDDKAAVVWQASYTPFGEANIAVETVTNNLRFPGQYYDQESGLHYNYFRDYDPDLGRYIESDPIGLNGGVNTYGYVGGNPIGYVDSLGLWPSRWFIYHQGAIYRNIPIPRELQEVLVKGQEYADSDPFQTGANSYRHGMRNKGQSKCEAMAAANEFIKEQYRKAWRLRTDGKIKDSLFEFSIGLHTLQDSTSPSHSGFQEWSDNPGRLAVWWHVARESAFYTPSQMDALNKITKDAWNWYEHGGLPRGGFFPSNDCGCQQ
ncbi:RHS domain-containing protein [Gallaecimonas kandeliae]|uniref:RHS repeat-associated core domain-containing protein n=1 Tax=Gallaecimonas kandeliae TaxID=3029055 RepID=UPI002649D2E0|nr:RHS repeat-associated core domain-containing protein [Gallaecimonas kandeliae]WKE66618.1 RHS domain-containing protein [Gallaecimonas kandeliae]